MYYSNQHTRTEMNEYYSHYLFNTFFTKKINISSYGDLLLMLDQLPDNVKPIMGEYLLNAANHYCNNHNYYRQQMSPKAYSYQYHAKAGVRSVSCECADCLANGRCLPLPSDGPTIEEIPNDEDMMAAVVDQKPQNAENKTENFDHISATFSKDLKAAAEAQAKQQQQSSSMQNDVDGDEKYMMNTKKESNSATTTTFSLLAESVPQSNNHKYAEQSMSSSMKQEASTKDTNGSTSSYNGILQPGEAKTVTSSSLSSSSNEAKFADSVSKLSQPQSTGSFTAATTTESVDGGVSTKNPRSSIILSPSTSSKPTITPRPVSAVSSGTTGSNSSINIFDDSTFSNFFSDLKLPSGNAKSSLFDFSPSASAASSKKAASTAAEQKNDDKVRELEDNETFLKTDMKSVNDPPVYQEIDISAYMASASCMSKMEKEKDQMYNNSRKSLKQEKEDRSESITKGYDNNGYGQNKTTDYGYGGGAQSKDDRFEDPFCDAYEDDEPFETVQQQKPSVLDPPMAAKKTVEPTVVNYESGCVFCPTMSHLSKDCTHYRDSFARMNRAEVLNRCVKCLELGHKKEHCPNVDRLKCSVCYLPHIALMCHCGNNVSFYKKN